MSLPRNILDVSEEAKPSSEDDASPSPSNRRKKSPSASPPIKTDSRLIHRNPSLLGLAEVVGRHDLEELEIEGILQLAAHSGRSHASTIFSTPQTTPPPNSPTTGQSISPLSAALLDSPTIVATLPTLTAESLVPQIRMPDHTGILASADETNSLTLAAQNKLVAELLKAYPLNSTFVGDHKEYIESLVYHIWEENLEILSLARYNCHVGIYYTPGINKTVQATGRAVHYIKGFFKPENVSFLTEYRKDAIFNVPSLQELNPKIANTSKDFDFSDAIIFLPICYTARHAVKAHEFFEVMQSFVFEKKCPIMIYLGRDAGLEENKIKRKEWLEGNQTYIQQIKEMYPDFWKENHSKIAITITHRHELIKMPQYLYAEYYFAHYLANEITILDAIKKDVFDRLIQKKYFTPPSKAVNINRSPSLTAPQLSVPQALHLSQRPHSYPTAGMLSPIKMFPSPTSGRISPSDELFARQMIERVRYSSAEQLDVYSALARERLHQRTDDTYNPFASIFYGSSLNVPTPMVGPDRQTSTSDEEEDEKSEEKSNVSVPQTRRK
jgi:hypothetical protein